MNIRTILGIAATVAFIFLLMHSYYSPKTISNPLARALNDTIRTTRDALNRETASKLTLVADKESLNTLLQSKDGLLKDKEEEIKRLMKATKNTVGGAYVKTITKDSIVDRPVYIDTTTHTYVYRGEDKWFSYRATASPDSLVLGYKVTNEYVMKQERVKGGIETVIKNLNPHTSVQEVLSYKVEYPVKKWGIGVSIGYGISTDFKPRPFIGITIQRTLIHF